MDFLFELVQTCSTTIIPRLVDAGQGPTSGGGGGGGGIDNENGILNPSEWTVDDVVQFLNVNDCSAYSENFINQVCLMSCPTFLCLSLSLSLSRRRRHRRHYNTFGTVVFVLVIIPFFFFVFSSRERMGNRYFHSRRIK